MHVSVSLAGLWESWGRSLSWCTPVSHSVGAQYIFVKWMNTGEENNTGIMQGSQIGQVNKIKSCTCNLHELICQPGYWNNYLLLQRKEDKFRI